MSLLSRIRGGSGPEWAAFMSGDEFRAFIGAVESYQLQRGRRFRLEDDGLFIEQPTGQDHVFGLSNLAQLCGQLRREEWPDAVAAHFQSLEEAADDERFSDPQAAMPYLKVRVYPRGQMPSETLEAMVSRPLTADLVAALVLDLPTNVQTITRETVAGWPEPMEQLFEIGLKHLGAEVSTYEPQQVELANGVRVHGYMGDSFFVASQVVRFGELVDDSPHGALVILPNRHSLLWHRLATVDAAVQAVQGMLRIGHQLYQEGPGSVSPELHWWHRGTLIVLPSAISNGKLDFFPPDAFLEHLDTLASREG